MSGEHTGALHREVREAYTDADMPADVTTYATPVRSLDLTYGVSCPHGTDELTQHPLQYFGMSMSEVSDAIMAEREAFTITTLRHLRAEHGCDCSLPERALAILALED